MLARMILFVQNANMQEWRNIKLEDGDQCPKCKGKIDKLKSIEVGTFFLMVINIPKQLIQHVDEAGNKKYVITGAYGIGLSRLMGTIAEVSYDAKGIVCRKRWRRFVRTWLHVRGWKNGDELFEKLLHNGVEVLYDDRTDKTAGEKFADADLLGCPIRLVVSEKTLRKNAIEVKRRNEKEMKMVPIDEVTSNLL